MSDSDKPVEVYECDVNLAYGTRHPFSGEPGRYVSEADFLRVVEMVRGAWEDGYRSRVSYYHDHGSNFKAIFSGSECKKRFTLSQTAARLRAMLGE